MHREVIDTGFARAGFCQRARLVRSANANGIAQRNFGASHCDQFRRETGHLSNLHLSLVWAAQHTGDVAADDNAIVLGECTHLSKASKAFINAAVDVAL